MERDDAIQAGDNLVTSPTARGVFGGALDATAIDAEQGNQASSTSFRVIEGAGDQQAPTEAPSLGLRRIDNRFGSIALVNSPWFGGVSVKPEFLRRGEANPHPRIMRSVEVALEGRNPRCDVVRDELRVTFDLVGPEEAPEVANVARSLGALFNGPAGYGVLRDKNAPPPEGDEATEVIEVQVTPLAQSDT